MQQREALQTSHGGLEKKRGVVALCDEQPSVDDAGFCLPAEAIKNRKLPLGLPDWFFSWEPSWHSWRSEDLTCWFYCPLCDEPEENTSLLLVWQRCSLPHVTWQSAEGCLMNPEVPTGPQCLPQAMTTHYTHLLSPYWGCIKSTKVYSSSRRLLPVERRCDVEDDTEGAILHRVQWKIMTF